MLLPIDGPNINLCKLLLGLYYLEYPTPVLVSWGQHGTDTKKFRAAGTHLTKITSMHEYLQSLPSSADNDLVVMVDTVDVWVQLPASVLISRYHAALKSTLDTFASQTNGQNTIEVHHLMNSIIFGSGKKCAPMQYHTIACYPMPDSPLPDDLYGANTDSVLGREPYFSYRQRYLNSGFIMGPLAAMRKMFAEAQRRLDTTPLIDPEDNGSGKANNLYRGSDQSIFARMLGRQEWAREALRVGWNQDRARKGFETQRTWPWQASELKPREGRMHGLRFDNVLEPNFSHEPMNYTEFEDDPSQFEFGIALDYWSDLVYQTNSNSEEDARWLVMGELDGREARMEEQVEKAFPRNKFDCPKMRLPMTIPLDMSNAQLAEMPDWEYEKLYMHVCLGKIPAFVHRNTVNATGFKSALETDWYNIWYLQQGKERVSGTTGIESGIPDFEHFKLAPQPVPSVIAWTKDGDHLPWNVLCPAEWNPGLFSV